MASGTVPGGPVLGVILKGSETLPAPVVGAIVEASGTLLTRSQRRLGTFRLPGASTILSPDASGLTLPRWEAKLLCRPLDRVVVRFS